MAITAVVDHLDHDFNVLHTVIPNNLSWTEVIRGSGDISYTLGLKHMYWTPDGVAHKMKDGGFSGLGTDYLGPYRTNFRVRFADLSSPWDDFGGVLQRLRMAGLHTGLSGTWRKDNFQVAGKDWWHYAERRVFPFDARPAHVNDYVIGTPPTGRSFQVPASAGASARPEQLAKTVIDHVLAVTDSLPITVSIESGTGIPIDYELSLGDTTTLAAIVDQLAQLQSQSAFTGFDYWMGPNRTLHIWTPNAYGDPTALVAAGASVSAGMFYANACTAYLRDTDPTNTEYDVMELTFNNNGPGGTHVKGFGAGLTNNLGVTIGYVAGEAAFWRLDDIKQFGNITSASVLRDLTQAQLSYDLNPVHTITLRVNVADGNRFSWLAGTWGIRPGMAVYLDYNLGWHHIQSPHQITSLRFSQNDNLDSFCDIGLQQIYDVGDSSFVGNPEG